MLLNQSLNDIIKKAIKYDKIKQKQLEHNMKYSKNMREVKKDVDFIAKQRQYAKLYYEKNKDKVDKKNLERYYKKKALSVETKTKI